MTWSVLSYSWAIVVTPGSVPSSRIHWQTPGSLLCCNCHLTTKKNTTKIWEILMGSSQKQVWAEKIHTKQSIRSFNLLETRLPEASIFFCSEAQILLRPHIFWNNLCTHEYLSNLCCETQFTNITKKTSSLTLAALWTLARSISFSTQAKRTAGSASGLSNTNLKHVS